MKPIYCAVLAALIPLLTQCGKQDYTPSTDSGDWPQYRADAGRGGYTPSELPRNASLAWKLEQTPPTPSWRGTDTRMTFDYACHAVIAGDALFFGSSSNCTVRALDAATGQEKWSFITGGPVRFAPVAWRDRLFAASDDGYLYCLSADRGRLLWKKRGGPASGMVIANDTMVSRLPVRGGPVMHNDVLYFGAGIWPSEGIYLYALDPLTGEELWVNSESGGMEMDQPHTPSRSKSGVSAQGYLAVGGERLLVPTGRAVPAAFDIATGKFDYFHLRKYAGGWQKNSYGGSRITVAEPYFLAVSGNTHDRNQVIGARNALFDIGGGELATRDEFDSPAIAVTPEYIMYLDARDRALKAVSRGRLLTSRTIDTPPNVSRRHLNTDVDRTIPVQGEVRDNEGRLTEHIAVNEPDWSMAVEAGKAISLVAAGGQAVIGADNNRVIVVDTTEKTVCWTADVDGVPWGLAVAHGRLYVSTDKGTIYCFDGGGVKRPNVIVSPPVNDPYGDGSSAHADAAEEILRKTGAATGYCLDFGCGDGRLAFELAKRSDLKIIAVDSDPASVERARKYLAEAGLYGSRVMVFPYEPDTGTCPDYFADLVVSGRSVSESGAGAVQTDAARYMRPCGGIACIGKPGAMDVTVRGTLAGSGEWTHQYHDPGNTVFSTDDLVRGNLGVLWYRDPDYTMPSRHGRAVSPLYGNGRLFVQGLHGVRAHNAYNGRVLWEYYIEDVQKANDQDTHLGTNLTQANWCLGNDRLYIRTEDAEGSPFDRYCVVLDAATGGFVRKIAPPRISGNDTWGYIAVDNGAVFGSVVADSRQLDFGRDQYLHIDTSKMYDESKALFALDEATGETKWVYRADHSIHHNTIAIGGGRVYFIDRPAPPQGRELRHSGKRLAALPAGVLTALDAESGEVVYRKRGDTVHGNLIALDTRRGLLVMTYYEAHPILGLNLPSDVSGRMTCFRASDGGVLWTADTGMAPSAKSRPIIIDDRVFIEPYSWNIATGEPLDIPFERSYGCGMISASNHMMFFRSGTLGFRDLDSPVSETDNYGGIRPGCWINAIPAGGLVLMPDATDRCNCSYLMRATIALAPQ